MALVLILVGLPLTVLGYQFVLRPALAGVRTIDITAAAPELGGFQPESIRVAAGETVRLRFSVPDVTHGVAIGPGLGIDLGHIDPGEVREVEVTFDEPGRYSFYCNTWCSPNHWRMRGAIHVYDPDHPNELAVEGASDPIIEQLMAHGEDIDASRDVVAAPSDRPSAQRGAEAVAHLGDRLPPALRDPLWRRGHSPTEAWMVLVESGLHEIDAWDAVANLWLSDTDPAQLEGAGSLYAKNCAACHGEHGEGEGPGAEALVMQGVAQDGMMGKTVAPTAFADPRVMLSGTREIYYAKLRRGGMGTGMPSFGQLLTSEESWALAGYLWLFVFDD